MKIQLLNSKVRRYIVRYKNEEYTSLLHFTKHYNLKYASIHKLINNKIDTMRASSLIKPLIKLKIVINSDLNNEGNPFKLSIIIHNKPYSIKL